MDRLRQSLDLIRTQLGALSGTHRLLIASAVLVLIMALLLVSAYSARTEMSPLKVDAARKAEALSILKTGNFSYKEEGGTLYVASDQQMQAMAALSQAGAATGENAIDMMELMKSQQWWQNRAQNQQLLNAATAKYLSQIITNWSYVESANVIINAPIEQPALGRPTAKPTASVSIATRTGELNVEQVQAVAEFIAGAVVGLTTDNVKIIDSRSGRSLRAGDPARITSGTYAELRARVENDYEQKILSTLRFIPNVIVAVNAQLDIAEEVVSDTTFKEEGKGTLQVPVRTRTNSTESGTKSDGGVPGVQPNTGTSLQASSSTGNSSKTNEAENDFNTFAGERVVRRNDPKGYAKKVNAAVNIPRSFFELVWKQQNPTSANEPTDTDLEPIISRHKVEVENMVRPLIDTAVHGTGDEGGASLVTGSVVVTVFHDLGGIGSVDVGSASTASFGSGLVGSVLSITTGPIGRIARDVVLGLFSLAALVMMFKLVKSASAKQPLLSAEEIVGIPPVLKGDADLIGEADASEPAMEAVELREGDIRIQGLIDQVDEMVESNPEDTARLVGRWLSNAA